MAGLGLGSWIISKYVDALVNLPKIYAIIELGIGLYGVLLLSLFNLLPNMYNVIYALHGNFYLFQIVQFLVAFAVLLVPTTLMGATFPVIAKYYTKEKIGKGIGTVYAANNFGAIIGSLVVGFLLIPILGIKFTIIIAATINILISFTLLIIVAKDSVKKIMIPALILFILFAYFGNYNIQQMHSGGFYRTNPEIATLGDVVYYGEGVYSTVTVRALTKGEDPKNQQAKALFVNGIGQGGTEINDLRVNFLLSYLPILIQPDINQALVIGLGTGMTSGQLAPFTKVTTIEIEPKIVEASTHFTLFNQNVLENPHHTLIIDDARHYLLTKPEKYDLIISEPTSTWQSFSAQLFSKEFLEIVRNNLDEKGIFIKWVPIYSMDVNDFKNFYKTFTSVFPYTVAFANIRFEEDTPVKFGTSQILLVGSMNPIEVNKEKIVENYDSLPEYSKQYLDAIHLSSGEEIYSLFLFDSAILEGYADDAQLVIDDKPILEFSTAIKVYDQKPQDIIDDINKFLMENEG